MKRVSNHEEQSAWAGQTTVISDWLLGKNSDYCLAMISGCLKRTIVIRDWILGTTVISDWLIRTIVTRAQ